jgi:hypothetical protein
VREPRARRRTSFRVIHVIRSNALVRLLDGSVGVAAIAGRAACSRREGEITMSRVIGAGVLRFLASIAVLFAVGSSSCESTDPGPCRQGEACVCERDCDQRCDGNGCGFTCEAGARCDFACDSGDCGVSCEPGSDCALECPGGRCSMTCSPDASCEITDCGAGQCTLACEGSDDCTNACGAEQGCVTAN